MSLNAPRVMSSQRVAAEGLEHRITERPNRSPSGQQCSWETLVTALAATPKGEAEHRALKVGKHSEW